MKSSFRYYFITLIIIIIVIYYLIDRDYISYLKNISLLNYCVSCLIALLIYCTSGFQYFFFQKKNERHFDLYDIGLIPIVSNLWSFIIPFQGSLLFSTLYLKSKYKLSITNSFSINIYLYLLTVVFAGATGLLFAGVNDMLCSWFGIISLALLLSPCFILFCYFILNRYKPVFQNRFLTFISDTILSISTNISKLLSDKSYTFKVLMLHITRTLLCVIWFQWIAYSLGLSVSFHAILLLSLLMDVSLIIKLTPDNLGVAQVFSGILMASAGLEPHIGVLISLFSSITAMSIIFTIGIAGNYYCMKQLNIPSVKQMFNDLKKIKR